MKKKILALALSLVLGLGMGTSVLAAPSPVWTPPKATAIINGVEINVNTEVKFLAQNANQAQEEAIDAFFKPWNNSPELEGLGVLDGDEYVQKYSELLTKYMNESLKKYFNITCEKIIWEGELDISLPEGVQMPAGGIDVTIKDSMISAGNQVILVHFKDDGSIEQIKNIKVEEGAVTGHFDSLSPVVYFVAEGVKSTEQQAPLKTTVQQHQEVQAGTTAQTANSPKTGEQGTAAPFCLAGLAVVCGAVYFGRKRFRI